MQSRLRRSPAANEMRRCRLSCRFPEPDIPSTADVSLLVHKKRRCFVADVSHGISQRPDRLRRLPILADFNERQARTLQGRMANTRAGKPEPPFGLGKATTTIAPDS